MAGAFCGRSTAGSLPVTRRCCVALINSRRQLVFGFVCSILSILLLLVPLLLLLLLLHAPQATHCLGLPNELCLVRFVRLPEAGPSPHAQSQQF